MQEKRTFLPARLCTCSVIFRKRKLSRRDESEKIADRRRLAWQKAETRIAKETEPWR
jgi:hypothetical protein